jgi:N-acetylglucosamine-6-sulfatase
MSNLLSSQPTSPSPNLFAPLNRPLDQVSARLDALLMVLKSCKANACTEPWKILHPDGSSNNLIDALNEKYDTFYAGQPKVSFEKCELGYIVGSEGPQTPNFYGSGAQYAEWT